MESEERTDKQPDKNNIIIKTELNSNSFFSALVCSSSERLPKLKIRLPTTVLVLSSTAHFRLYTDEQGYVASTKLNRALDKVILDEEQRRVASLL